MRLFFFTFLVLLAPAAPAQTLATGEWTGQLEWSNADPVPLTATIETCAEGLKISLSSDDARYHTEETIIAQSGPVDFSMQNLARGYTLACSLSRQNDGGLSGNCATGSSRARLTLTPPDQSTIGCSE